MIKPIVISTPAGNTNILLSIPDALGQYPICIQFPGDGQAGSDINAAYSFGPFYFMKNKGWNPQDMIYAFAQTPYHGGTYGNTVAIPFLRAVMQELINSGKYPMDKNRIYLTGLSYGADHLLCYIQHEDDAHYIPIAAIVPMSMAMNGSIGKYPSDTLGGNDVRFSKMKIWGFCGINDKTGFREQMIHFNGLCNDPNAQAKGYNMLYNDYYGAHDSWNLPYDNSGANIITSSTPSIVTSKKEDIYTWMKRNSLASSSVVTTPPPVIPVAVPTLVSITLNYSDKTSKTLPVV